MGKYKVRVTASALHVRTGTSTSYKIIDLIYKNQEYISSKQANGWYYIDAKGGWSSGRYLKVVENLTPKSKATPVVVNKPKHNDPKTYPVNSTSNSIAIDKKVIDMMISSVKKKEGIINASTRLFGAPFQFTKQTDFRITTGEYALGRKYVESIVSESPIVYFLPGRPNYLPNLSETEKNALKEMIKNLSEEEQKDKEKKSIFDRILGTEESRYFDFLSDYSTYMRYVNLLCRVAAIYMGLGDKTAPNSDTPYKLYDWSNYRYHESYKIKKEKKKHIFDLSEIKPNIYEALFGNYNYTQFYVDPSLSFNETASNQTQRSRLEDRFESMQGIVKELAFFAQTAAVSQINDFKNSVANTFDKWMQKIIRNHGENFFSRLLSTSSRVLDGSNLIFPELWEDAAYNKSYNITINLVSPYGDKESIYLNIIVPLMHLLALALPRQTSANSFGPPFLVRVSSKGWFNCEMGVIDHISIEKGGQDAWSVDGLPTEMKVQVSVKDLYSGLMITPNSRPDLFYENKGLINWLAITCGVDITQPAFMEKWWAIFMTLATSIKDIPYNIVNDVVEKVRNKIEPLYKFL